MRHARLLSSTPFRLAVIFTTLFVAAFVVSGFVAVQAMRGELLHKLDRQVQDTYAIVIATFGENDAEDLIASVESHIAVADSEDQIFLLTGPDRKRILGNIPAVTVLDGLSTVSPAMLGLPGTEPYRVFVGDVNGHRLLVGKSYADMDEIGEIAAATFTWATIIVLIGAVGGGTLLAHRLQRRIDAIADTMARISEGEMAARIPLLGNNDDIDTLSEQVNGTLDRLASLFEAMRQVSADIAHDLKTPLNRLKLTIQGAIEKQAAGLPFGNELQEADSESDNINRTFDALLRIAQIEGGARRARFARVDLNDIAIMIGEAFTEVAADNHQSLAVTCASGAAMVSGDRQLLLQLASNLVENAITHGPPGNDIALRVVLTANRAVLSVADHGPGIPATEHGNVLRRLYRLEKSRSTPGSGLGLSMVKAIADLHGATLSLADNAPGLRVSLDFPLTGVSP